jgi:hypothetical protein
MSEHDAVNHPKHYTSHPAKCVCSAGIECIQITEHMGFNLGNAVKYVWRADLKSDAIEDLKKARWYIDRELLKRGATVPPEYQLTDRSNAILRMISVDRLFEWLDSEEGLQFDRQRVLVLRVGGQCMSHRGTITRIN